jgi:hypothetical protein
MTRVSRWLLPASILLLGLIAAATPGSAAQTSYVTSKLSSTGSGTCSITIESFGLLAAESPRTPSVQAFVINVPIPAASSPANSAALIRNALDSGLPPDYFVFVPAGAPHLVQVFRDTGTFTLGVVEDVPTQIIEPYVVPVPLLGGGATILIALLLLATGAWVARSRSRGLAPR